MITAKIWPYMPHPSPPRNDWTKCARHTIVGQTWLCCISIANLTSKGHKPLDQKTSLRHLSMPIVHWIWSIDTKRSYQRCDPSRWGLNPRVWQISLTHVIHESTYGNTATTIKLWLNFWHLQKVRHHRLSDMKSHSTGHDSSTQKGPTFQFFVQSSILYPNLKICASFEKSKTAIENITYQIISP